MSKPAQTDAPTESITNKHSRLELQEHIQRGIVLATQLCQAASKEHLGSKEWTANQAAANENVRIFFTMKEKTASISKTIDGFVAAQVKVEVKMKMDLLDKRCRDKKLYPDLCGEIETYLRPFDANFRELFIKMALKKMEGVSSTDLSAKVSEAVESAILEVLHKGIDGQMRGYMK